MHQKCDGLDKTRLKLYIASRMVFVGGREDGRERGRLLP